MRKALTAGVVLSVVFWQRHQLGPLDKRTLGVFCCSLEAFELLDVSRKSLRDFWSEATKIEKSQTFFRNIQKLLQNSVKTYGLTTRRFFAKQFFFVKLFFQYFQEEKTSSRKFSKNSKILHPKNLFQEKSSST